MKDELFDVAVIGGGINGTGIAADAALRGLRVLLCEQGDLASATSSASSKLIHGGLRYLEQGELSLVKQALTEQGLLLKNAKHLVKPLTFILPFNAKSRSRFMVRVGLFLYDHLAKKVLLPHTKAIKLHTHPAYKYLKKDIKYAIQYSDCQTDDARLVLANALQAAHHQAVIRNYTKCIAAKRMPDHWQLDLQDMTSQRTYQQRAKTLINATGPWVVAFLNDIANVAHEHTITHVKGSHIIVPRLYEEDFAYILQHDDKRVVFVIPYLSEYHLVGTTESYYRGDLNKITIAADEITYLLTVVNNYFTKPIKQEEIIHSFSGVRPLIGNNANPTQITRDYAIEVNQEHSMPPLVSIFGGKLTTFRRLAEKVVNSLSPYFTDLKASTTATTFLPGGNYSSDKELRKKLQQHHPWLSATLLSRYLKQYGYDTFQLLQNCTSEIDLGNHFDATLYQREVDYLIANEWAKNAEDILWRRTKLGFYFATEKIAQLNDYICASLQQTL